MGRALDRSAGGEVAYVAMAPRQSQQQERLRELAGELSTIRQDLEDVVELLDELGTEHRSELDAIGDAVAQALEDADTSTVTGRIDTLEQKTGAMQETAEALSDALAELLDEEDE